MIVPILPKLPTEPADLCGERDRLTHLAGYGRELWGKLPRQRKRGGHPKPLRMPRPTETVHARRQVLKGLAEFWRASGRTPKGMGNAIARCCGLHHTTVYYALGMLKRKVVSPQRAQSNTGGGR